MQYSGMQKELLQEIRTEHPHPHDGKIWKCDCPKCEYEAIDKQYLKAHKKVIPTN